MKEPARWQSGIPPADALDRNPADETNRAPEVLELRIGKVPGTGARVQPSFPKDFIGHPVSQARKASLQKQRGFEGKSAMALKEARHPLGGKLFRGHSGRQVAPPGRWWAANVKSDAAKLPRVGKNQRALFEIKHQVIVLSRVEIRFFDAQFPRHSQMQAEPDLVGESKEHLFAVALGAEQNGLAEDFSESLRRGPPKNSFLRVQSHMLDGPSQSHIPPSAVKLNLSQFRHIGECDEPRADTTPGGFQGRSITGWSSKSPRFNGSLLGAATTMTSFVEAPSWVSAALKDSVVRRETLTVSS